MKKKPLITAVALLACLTAGAQQTVRISGNVKFIDDNFKMTVFRYAGSGREVLAEADVDPVSHNYTIDVPVAKPGLAVVDCGRWQDVRIWLENEDLGIDFRGVDTAKIKIKNPPYVYIRGGKNNDLMNLINFQTYRNYQSMIAISQNVYKAEFANDKSKQDLTMALYNANNENADAYDRFFVEHFADRNSVLVPLEGLNQQKDKELIDATLDKLAAQSEQSARLVAKYKADKEEQRMHRERCAIGAVAPDFTSLTQKGKKVRPQDFKGKVLVIDFWASWCGPCRAEIPKMKAIYTDMDRKKVEFLSVSIDSKREAWEKAMKEEQMPWTLTWTPDAGKEVMDLYQFNGIPFIIVVDKDGKIFRKNLRGEALRDAINEALNM
ncbi:MAG: TlpA family protein disulfide reductase [Prevotella sp.]|nr:TlpA family protein disulfide reductase [Prevotella sp.]